MPSDLETPRLGLRPRSLEDLEACLAMDSDPEVMRYVGGAWEDRMEYEAYFRERVAFPYPAGLGYWSVFPKQDPGRLLGWVTLVPCDGQPCPVEIGWRLARAEWGKGYATEAAAALLRHGFENVGLDRIAAYIHPRNLPSMRVAERIGLAFLGDGDYGGEPCKTYELSRRSFRPAGAAERP